MTTLPLSVIQMLSVLYEITGFLHNSTFEVHSLVQNLENNMSRKTAKAR